MATLLPRVSAGQLSASGITTLISAGITFYYVSAAPAFFSGKHKAPFL